jgi:hypothetical protein
MEVLNRVVHTFKKRPARSNTQATASATGSKAKDLLAFRTIITMLSQLHTPKTRSATNTPMATTKEHRRDLRVLDALSVVLIREHEITAVMAKPYDGCNIQVFASVVDSGNAEPPLQPDAELASGVWGVGEWFRNFTIALNPRYKPIYGHSDSLINSTLLPTIGDHQVPEELVTAAKENLPVLNIFFEKYW